ncbi:MAG: Gfo/Idh/MocA family oxidoreductase, partial [Acidimicrobiales bacterium]|nr:Gfo/Idh/MocA family oxidoreductase [Acidimicrobiales bacterium]
MRAAVIGLGAVGTRAARQLASTDEVERVYVCDTQPGRVDEVASALGSKGVAHRGSAEDPPQADIVVVATPCGTQLPVARARVAAGLPVVTTSDRLEEVRALLDLGAEAEARGTTVAVGATFSPGLTCLLARLAADRLDQVDEIHVARL